MTYRDVLRCELARRDFWEYCKLLAPDFYKEDRKFLKDKCREYQDFYESADDILLKFAVIISKHNEKWVLFLAEKS